MADDPIKIVELPATTSFNGVIAQDAAATNRTEKVTVAQVAAGVNPLLDHGEMEGLNDDDHTQYPLVDGSRGFSAPVSGVAPVDGDHLVTKNFIEDFADGFTQLPKVVTSATAGQNAKLAGVKINYEDIALKIPNSGDEYSYNVTLEFSLSDKWTSETQAVNLTIVFKRGTDSIYIVETYATYTGDCAIMSVRQLYTNLQTTSGGAISNLVSKTSIYVDDKPSNYNLDESSTFEYNFYSNATNATRAWAKLIFESDQGIVNFDSELQLDADVLLFDEQGYYRMTYSEWNQARLRRESSINYIRAQEAVIEGASYKSLKMAGGLRADGENWEDVNLDVTGLTGIGTDPSLRILVGNISIAGFRGTATDEISTSIEVPHNRQTGTPIGFHAHCYAETAGVGDVYLELEYVFSYEGQVIGSPTVISAIQSTPGATKERFTIYFPMINIPVSPIDGKDFAPQFHFRFARLGGDSSDTYNDWVQISTIGAHFNVDSLGSDLEKSKTYE